METERRGEAGAPLSFPSPRLAVSMWRFLAFWRCRPRQDRRILFTVIPCTARDPRCPTNPHAITSPPHRIKFFCFFLFPKRRPSPPRKKFSQPLISPLNFDRQLVIYIPMEQTPPSLGDRIATLRMQALARENCVYIPDAIHALIIACLARIFARLEDLVRLWQAGALPLAAPRATKRPKTARRRSPRIRGRRASRPRRTRAPEAFARPIDAGRVPPRPLPCRPASPRPHRRPARAPRLRCRA